MLNLMTSPVWDVKNVILDITLLPLLNVLKLLTALMKKILLLELVVMNVIRVTI